MPCFVYKMSITSAQTANQSNTTKHMDMKEANDDKSLVGTTGTKSTLPGKRTGYLDWHEYFMAVAFLSAQRSKDPRTQVGACIVNDEKKIVGIGYNGMPIGCSDDLMPWNQAENKSKEKWLESKKPYVCHAELNAVLNKNMADIKGCVIYVALFPCNMCAQIIIQSRISEVIYYSDKYHDRPEFTASRRLLDTAKVKYWQFRPRQKTITIDFDLIETTPGDVLPVPDESRDDSSTVDGNITSTSGHDEVKINSDTRNGSELLHSKDSVLSQPQDVIPLQLKNVQQQSLKPQRQHMFNNFNEVIFAIVSACIVFLAAIVSYSKEHNYSLS